ncbi:hypothetical protein CSV80_08090 [Sporosarcina sp. P12(2017)]|uniref:hypothetical protein n=1 Tax=unclassified Sporosarcina TaxID=2647733 RepID=UPI000C1706CA|nr:MULTISPECIES: hypothetical protein [unclassified Sporosarcina]PIC57540.1 hypothetical protein CSV81_08415 [Sporosarcina sp. P10]PIC60922.1 hypothetical protein CSV80_08090 [Sporosarcina sp. P12(2017)]
MKKWMSITILSCLLFLTACAATDTNKLTIPELSDREKQILETAANTAFVFDYTADQNYKKVTLWVEKYEKGKKVAEPISELSTPMPGESTKGSIVLTVTQTLEEELLFSASVSDDKGAASISNQEELKTLKDMATLFNTNPQEGLLLSDNMLLAGIIYTSTTDGSPTSTLSSDFYEQKEGYLDELKEYDVVYVLRASFQK